MDAVTDDHGVYDNSADYYNSSNYKNRPNAIKLFVHKLLIGSVNELTKAIQVFRKGFLHTNKNITELVFLFPSLVPYQTTYNILLDTPITYLYKFSYFSLHLFLPQIQLISA